MHSCNIEAMKALKKALNLQGQQQVQIYYAIPAEHMNAFTLTPTPAKLKGEIPENCEVFFLTFADPKKQF